MPQAFLKTHHDDLLSPDRQDQKKFITPRWERLLRGGTNSRREDREYLFYPIFIDPEKKIITGVGEPLPLDKTPDIEATPERTVAWPIERMVHSEIGKLCQAVLWSLFPKALPN
jgi:adenine-specific DNA-methyltransferase